MRNGRDRFDIAFGVQIEEIDPLGCTLPFYSASFKL